MDLPPYRAPVLEAVSRLLATHSHALVRIVGGSGSGKSYLARHVHEWLAAENIAAIEHPQDAYYHGIARIRDHNFDHPSALDLELYARHVRDLLAGTRIERPRYDFSRYAREEQTDPVNAPQIVVAEGLFLLGEHMPGAWPSLDLFVDASEAARFSRRAYRDVRERGRTPESVAEQWVRTVRPMYERFVLPQRDLAHIVVHNGSYLPEDGVAAPPQSLNTDDCLSDTEPPVAQR